MSVLEQIVEEYPNAKWNWIQLSLNPAISFEFIKSHPELPWNIKALTLNKNITTDIIDQHQSYNWDYHNICANPNITFDYILNTMITPNTEIFIDYNKLSMNKAITIADIEKHIDKPWNFAYVSFNPNITSNYILNEGKNKSWNMAAVSANPGITEADIYKNKLNWDYTNLSCNINLPTKYISDNINQPWNYYSISANPNTTISELSEFQNIPWDYKGLSINPHMHLQYILDHNDNPWDYKMIISHPNISHIDILNNIDLIRSVGKISSDDVKKYLCNNNNITYEWIKDNIKYIDFGKLSFNSFKY